MHTFTMSSGIKIPFSFYSEVLLVAVEITEIFPLYILDNRSRKKKKKGFFKFGLVSEVWN